MTTTNLVLVIVSVLTFFALTGWWGAQAQTTETTVTTPSGDVFIVVTEPNGDVFIYD